MGENRWRGYEEWPVPGAYEERWHLRGGGRLAREAPSRASRTSTTTTRGTPVPTVGGAILWPYPPSRRPRPARDRGPPRRARLHERGLREDYTVLGPAHATVFAATSAPDTDFVVRLVDVYPDGRAIGVADGVIRASAREAFLLPASQDQPGRSPSSRDAYTVTTWTVGDRNHLQGRAPHQGAHHLELLPALGPQPEYRRGSRLGAHRGARQDLPRPRAPEPRHADRRRQIEEEDHERKFPEVAGWR